MKKLVIILGLLAVLVLALSACQPTAITHPVEGRRDCLSCHGSDGVKPYPKFHADEHLANSSCTGCHKPASSNA